MSAKENVAAVLSELRKFELKPVAYPKPKPHHVVIKMMSVGICGSDVHYWAHGRCGPFILNGPIVLGHESSGIIEEVGEGVTHVKPGDRVAIEPGVPCRMCHHCKTGVYNLCHDMKFLATPPIDGSLAQYLEHAADFVFKLPDTVSLDEGALLEPLSVGVHAAERGHIGPGSHVLILGAGPIGLVNVLVARAVGATTIVVTDIKDDRLEMAKKLGANVALRADSPNVLEEILKHGPITHSIECSGAEPSINLAIRATDNGGKVLLIGRSAKPTQNVPLFDAADKEIDLIGSFRYRNTYPKALALIAAGKVDVKPLITHYFPLDKVSEAFEQCETGRDGAIKVVIQVNKP